MTNAGQRGWGNPDSLSVKNKMCNIEVGNTSWRVHRAVGTIFKFFLEELLATGYGYDKVEDDWGYANRDIRGRPGVKSEHSWGTAIDVNATKNPMSSTLITDMPVGWVRANVGRFGLRWGGDYDGRKDAMHFEFMGTPGEAAGLARDLIEARKKKAGMFTMDKEAATAFRDLQGSITAALAELKAVRTTLVAHDRNCKGRHEETVKVVQAKRT